VGIGDFGLRKWSFDFCEFSFYQNPTGSTWKFQETTACEVAMKNQNLSAKDQGNERIVRLEWFNEKYSRHHERKFAVSCAFCAFSRL